MWLELKKKKRVLRQDSTLKHTESNSPRADVASWGKGNLLCLLWKALLILLCHQKWLMPKSINHRLFQLTHHSHSCFYIFIYVSSQCPSWLSFLVFCIPCLSKTSHGTGALFPLESYVSSSFVTLWLLWTSKAQVIFAFSSYGHFTFWCNLRVPLRKNEKCFLNS